MAQQNQLYVLGQVLRGLRHVREQQKADIRVIMDNFIGPYRNLRIVYHARP